MTRVKSVCMVASLLLGAASGLCRAAPVLDQNNTLATGVVGGNSGVGLGVFAQTLVVGLSGTFSAFDAYLWNPNVGRGTVTATILRVDASGAPSTLPGDVLGTATVSYSSIPRYPNICCILPDLPYTEFDFSSDGISVTAGEELAVQLTAPPAFVIWGSDATADYPAGSAYYFGAGRWQLLAFGNTDFGFRTYVEPAVAIPEPSGLFEGAAPAVLWAGIVLRNVRRRRAP
ncbi:MAG TPA: hypothetical protein VME92_09110 [Acetobacteraceae bacterium]|nr:hypothetical protein [Acetobacteraceae bacterium]